MDRTLPVCVFARVLPQVQCTLMQNALDAAGPNPPPALGSSSPTAAIDIPPPLPPNHHGNDSPDGGGSFTKVEWGSIVQCIVCVCVGLNALENDYKNYDSACCQLSMCIQ